MKLTEAEVMKIVYNNQYERRNSMGTGTDYTNMTKEFNELLKKKKKEKKMSKKDIIDKALKGVI